MELIPAIDLLDAKVVRLHQGDYRQVTVYADDPIEQARSFERQGAGRLHVVDLEGARSGLPSHMNVIKRIVAAVRLPVQVGGGIRDRNTLLQWLDAGVDRVVLGTAAIKEPEETRQLCSDFPNKVVIAVDARDGRVATEGWLQQSDVAVDELAERVDGWGAAAILYTDISRDGTRVGPAVESTAALQRNVKATVIASGGIGSVDDLRSLKEAGVRAAVCGRALL